MVEKVPLNPVTAQVLSLALQMEYGKEHWRTAFERARARWQAEGHKPERLPSVGKGERRKSGFYVD